MPSPVGTTQYPTDVNRSIGLNDHARIRRARGDVLDMQAGWFQRHGRVCLVVDARQLQVVKLDEVAFQLVVDGPQFRDTDFTAHGEIAIRGALHVELAR